MSVNNVLYLKKEGDKWVVYYQGCADNDDLGRKEQEFNTAEEALEYAQNMIDNSWVEYGIRFKK